MSEQFQAEYTKKESSKPWKYKEGFLISSVILIIGTIIEIVTGGKPINVPSFPTNLSVVISITFLLVALYKIERKNIVVQWLTSVPAAITSIIHVVVLGILLGMIPQVEKTPEVTDIWFKLGLKNMTSSWHYAFGYLFFLTTLGMATVKMLFSKDIKRRIGTLLSHFGLYLTVIAGIAGSGDLERLYFVVVYGNEPVSKAFDSNEQAQDMPFALTLEKFEIIEYHPKISLIEAVGDNSEIIMKDDNRYFVANEGDSATFGEYKIIVDTFYQYSLPYDSTMNSYGEYDKNPALPSAYVRVFKNSAEIQSGWVSCGNYRVPRKNLWLKDNLLVGMFSPEPKEYSSDITAYSGDTFESFTLKVNAPKKYKGWKLYQTGYNEELGKWSDYSVIEAGRDPWLPVVYTGIFILIAGAMYIFWKGQTFKKNEDLSSDSQNSKN